jgi:hypothetical protein
VQAKKEGLKDVSKSAAKIVQDAMSKNIDLNTPCPALSDPALLSRRVNRCRKSQRPTEPATLDFTVDQDFIGEGFLREDVKIYGMRHLVFATDLQLELLSKAKSWYVDGTFRDGKKTLDATFHSTCFFEEH